MSDFKLKNYFCAFSWKVNFTAVKDLFNWTEGLRRSVIVLVGSDTGLIVDLAVLSKKYLIRCQNSSSKIIFVRFHEKWISLQSKTCSMELRVYIGVSKFFKRANLLTIFTGHPNFLIFNSCCLKGCLYRKLHDNQSCLVLCVDIMCVCINKKWVRVGYVF